MIKSKESIADDDEGVTGGTLRRLSGEGYTKKAPLDAEFTVPESEEPKYDANGKKIKKKKKKKDKDEDAAPEIPTVGFFSLFREATAVDRFLLFIGVLGGIATGLVAPANTLLFGNLTGAMVDFGSDGLTPPGPGVTLPPDVIEAITQKFLDEINKFAISNSILGAIMLVMSYVSVFLFNYVAQKQIFKIRDKFLKSALHQDIGWYDLNQSGDFASRMAEDLSKLEEGIGEKVILFLHFQLSFLGSIILAFVKGWELALICLISLPVTMISVGLVAIITSKLAKNELTAYGKAGVIAEEVLSSIRTVMAFGGQEKEVTRYQANLIYAKKNNVKRGFFSGLGFGLLWFFIYASYALAFWYGVGLVLRERDDPNPHYDAGTMVTVFFSVMMGSMNLGISSPYIEVFSIAKGAGAKVFSVIERVSPIDSSSPSGDKPAEMKGSISFKGVHFNYPSRAEVKILQGLTLTINRGETVALVGSSGCGKSTCIQLIQRFYDPMQGSVELDGVDVKTLNVAWLRQKIGVVGQEPVLFATTIAENIRYGMETATLDEIKDAAKEANAHDFISKLPRGYDTLVGERGAQMSGGQKQRIAIARALIRKPAILLLDEATSALDTGSEARVQQALDKASLGRTTVIVAHRLSTIRGADKIVVVSEGRVVEEGTHDELMTLSGHYHALVMAQIMHAEDEETGEGKEDPDAIIRPKKLSRMLSITSSRSGTSSVGEEDVHEHDFEDKEEDIPEVPFMRIIEKNKEEWPYIVVGCLSSIIMGCAMPIFAVLFGDILGILSKPDPDEVRSETNVYALYFLGAGLAVGFATFLQIYSFGVAGEHLTERLRGLAFSSMVRQEVAWFDNKVNSTGALLARLSGDAASVQGATGQRIGTILQSLATLFLGVGLSLSYEWRLGLVALSFTPIILIANYAFAGAIRGESLNNKAAMEASTKLAVEAVGNIRTVVSLGREDTFHKQYMDELRPAYLVALRNNHMRGFVMGLARSLMFFAFATCMYYGGQLVANEGLPYATVFKVSQALIMGTVSIANSIAFAPNFQKGYLAASRIFSLLDRKPKIYDPLTPLPGSDSWIAKGHVNYAGVEFFYETRAATKVLRGLNLIVKPGQTVALVGQSGCGKSTCIQLLERFYDPTSGTISVDELDISAVRLSKLRSQLGIVSQEPILFDRTIADNIAYGDNSRNVSMDEVIAAAKNANIHTFIASLPLGYETRMGEKGAQLSGGQKQRVAIARALVRNPRILLLDEATSALDTESEKVVQEALDKAKEGRTCITIAHRLSTIQDADVICVINRGRVAEMGKHNQLLAQRGHYYKLYSLQGGAPK